METVRRYGAWMDLVGVLVCLAIFVLGCTKAPTTTADSNDAAPATSVGSTTEVAIPRLAANVPEEKQPIVELRTSLGSIKLKLDAEHAPETVHNFMSYVASGHYNGTIFHQVEQGYAVLGGSFTPELSERPGRYAIRNEAANGLKNRRGTIAMARQLDAIDSATCQFVINLGDNSSLDHQGDTPETFGFCVFGEVIEGMDVLDQIAAVPVKNTDAFNALPVQAVVIESASRLR
ncbi:MAG TPA: peptidylprolyl isomerase [Pirellulales bacterium]|nr:peptidylprolyl isomerase [Pirellulales bacterium]